MADSGNHPSLGTLAVLYLVWKARHLLLVLAVLLVPVVTTTPAAEDEAPSVEVQNDAEEGEERPATARLLGRWVPPIA